MRALEQYYGVKLTKKTSAMAFLARTDNQKVRNKANFLMKEANNLFARGFHGQCFSILEQTVKLVPTDPRPFYLLGTIHEEMQNIQKAHTAYLMCALLKKNSITMWSKVRTLSVLLKDRTSQAMALERMCRREPSVELLREKHKCYQNIGRKYSSICCEIELFEYDGVDENIFEKFRTTKHQSELERICKRLIRCIHRDAAARTEVFLRETILVLFKIQDWSGIIELHKRYYLIYDSKTEIKIILLISRIGANCRPEETLSELDNYLTNENLESLDEGFLSEMAIQLKNLKLFQLAVRVMEKILSISDSLQHRIRMAEIFESSGDIQIALEKYHEVLDKDPTLVDVQAKMYELYIILGEEAKASNYKTALQIHEYATLDTEVRKTDHRYSTELCEKMRNVLKEARKLLAGGERRKYLAEVEFLLKDFFANAFVNLPNKNFKSFKERNERVANIDGIITFNENLSKRKAAEKALRISCLHGFDTDEWFSIVIEAVHCYILEERPIEARSVLEKAIGIHLFNTPRMVMELGLLLIRTAFISGDFDCLIGVIKRLTQSHGYSSAYLLYFFCNFVPNYHKHVRFHDFQRGLQRYYRKRLAAEVLNSTSPDDEVSGESTCSQGEECASEDVNCFLGANSYLPCYLFTSTVNFLVSPPGEPCWKTKLITGIICLTHTRNRAVINKMKYAKLGMKILNEIPEDTPVKWYNIAKAYHFYGYLAQAERLYIKVINEASGELQKMAAYNLQLIFRSNKSRDVIESWNLELAGKWRNS